MALSVVPEIFATKGQRAYRQRWVQKDYLKKPHPLMRRLEEILLETASLVRFEVKNILVMGTVSVHFFKQIKERYPKASIVYLDAGLSQSLENNLQETEIIFVKGEGSILPFGPNRFDLCFHNLDLHHQNDIPGLLRQLNIALGPDGLLIGSCLGGEQDTAFQKKVMQVSERVFGGVRPFFPPLIQAHTMPQLMQRAGFAISPCLVETIPLRYQTMAGLLQDIRELGQYCFFKKVNSGLQSKARRNQFIKAFEGEIEVFARFLIFSGRAPSSHQQQRISAQKPKHSLGLLFKK